MCTLCAGYVVKLFFDPCLSLASLGRIFERLLQFSEFHYLQYFSTNYDMAESSAESPLARLNFFFYDGSINITSV